MLIGRLLLSLLRFLVSASWMQMQWCITSYWFILFWEFCFPAQWKFPGFSCTSRKMQFFLYNFVCLLAGSCFGFSGFSFRLRGCNDASRRIAYCFRFFWAFCFPASRHLGWTTMYRWGCTGLIPCTRLKSRRRPVRPTNGCDRVVAHAST